MENKKVPFKYLPQWEKVDYETPAKKIINFDDVATFKKTKTYAELLVFLQELQQVPTLKLSPSGLRASARLSPFKNSTSSLTISSIWPCC